jgi:hypothetical protein
LTRERLEELGLGWEISGKGKPAPYLLGHVSVGCRAEEFVASEASPQEAHVVHREGGEAEIDFWVAFSDVVIIVRRLIREGWTRYRWEGRPSRRP